MGNNQAKEARPVSSRGYGSQSNSRNPGSPPATGAGGEPSQGRAHSGIYISRSGRGSRHDLSLFGLGGGSERDPALEPRRETKAEREARKLEKERALRAQERERSLREESVDGGYLVTLGTYTGPEDFSKPVVRQLQVERRLAPFWRGLNDHSDSWTEYQLIAVANGLPLPAPDEIPPEEPARSNNLSTEWSPRGSNSNINSLTVPITGRSMSQSSDRSASLSPSHPAFSLPSPTSPIAASPSSSPFFRGRAKTLAALTTGSRNNSQTDMAPQEIQLPKDPFVNGQRLEVFLYKNASECPICFLCYPPYLNKTRCCDQPICSECFVQIKRPDPHPPEHHEPSDPNAAPEPQEDNALVSEPAACPFCVQPEFGITYEPPPFRRGLAYANQGNRLANVASAMSSTSSLNSGLASPGRRRATSLAANDATVITTDRVRPDWAKKLADARSHALRRAAAATALHNAAYMMGNLQASESRGFGIGRRRRTTLFGSDSAGSSGHGTPRRDGEANSPLPGAAGIGGSSNRSDGQSDLTSGRQSSRRPTRLEDLEELMMMEAIRLSLAAEEERKKKEEKEALKEAKKDEKKKAKEAKKAEKAEKAARKSGFFPIPGLDPEGDNAGSSSTNVAAKGKGVDRSGASIASSSKDDPQRHLEQSRAQIQRETSNTSSSPLDSLNEHGPHRAALRNLSNASSSVSSFAESVQGSLRHDNQGDLGASASSYEGSPNASGVSLGKDETPPQGTPGTEPMFNFRSLEAIISKKDGAQHIENVADGEQPAVESSSLGKEPVGAGGSTRSTPDITIQPPSHAEPEVSKDSIPEPPEALEASVTTLRPSNSINQDDDDIEPAPRMEAYPGSSSRDIKHIGDVSMVGSLGPQTTQ